MLPTVFVVFVNDLALRVLTVLDVEKLNLWSVHSQDRIISRNLPLTREEVAKEEAEKRIKAINEPYKLEILEGIKTEPITIYKIGSFSQ